MILHTTEPIALAFRVRVLEQVGSGVESLINTAEGLRMIARQPGDEILGATLGQFFAKAPRTLRYEAQAAEPGLYAILYALITAEDARAVASDHFQVEPWVADDAEVAVFLGVLVRYKHDMKQETFELECIDHLGKVLAGYTTEPVEKAIEAMERGE